MDLMVINVSKTRIRQRRAEVSAFAFYPVNLNADKTMKCPIYWTYDNATPPNQVPNPYAQIIQDDEIPAIDPATGKVNYRTDGY